MGNSQPNSPAKYGQARNKRPRKQQQSGGEVIGERKLNHEQRQSAKASKRGSKHERKRSIQQGLDSLSKIKRSNAGSSTKVGIKVSKNEMSDNSRSTLVGQQQTKLSGKSKAESRMTSLAKNMIIEEEPLVVVSKISGQLSYMEGDSRETSPSNLEKARPFKHGAENHEQLPINSRPANKTKVELATTTGIESHKDISTRHISTTASLPPLVELRRGQPKIGACLKEEATYLKRSHLEDATTRLNREQMGVTDEIRVAYKARETTRTTMDGLETETTENSTILPPTAVKQGKEGVLSLTRGATDDNLNRNDEDGNNEKETDDDYDRIEPSSYKDNQDDKLAKSLMKSSLRSGRIQGDVEKRMPFVHGRGSFESVCLNAPHLFSKSSQSNLISKNNPSSKIASLPPLVAQNDSKEKNSTSVQSINQEQTVKSSSKQPAFGLSRSFSFNTILVNGANLLNLSSIVTRMKTQASDYTGKQAGRVKRICSNSSTTTTTATSTAPIMKLLPTASTRLPTINDNLSNMMESTSSIGLLMNRFSSVEDQRQKVKNWLESQPFVVVATKSVTSSCSASVDRLEEGEDDDEEERKSSRNGEVDVEEKGQKEEEVSGSGSVR